MKKEERARLQGALESQPGVLILFSVSEDLFKCFMYVCMYVCIFKLCVCVYVCSYVWVHIHA